MAPPTNRMQLSRESEAAVQRKTAQFQEAPGEAEADAVREAFLRGAGPQPGGVGSALAGADTATQAGVLSRLQRERGNAYVQRVVAESRGAPGRLVGLSQSEMVDEVRQRQDSGSPLSGQSRQQMEGYFGADLSHVRVHSGGEAATLSRELNANAFTVGSDIFFAEGKYNPGSADGQATLAHELTHVGQQGGFTSQAGQSVQRQNQQAPEEEEQAVQREESDEEQQAQ